MIERRRKYAEQSQMSGFNRLDRLNNEEVMTHSPIEGKCPKALNAGDLVRIYFYPSKTIMAGEVKECLPNGYLIELYISGRRLHFDLDECGHLKAADGSCCVISCLKTSKFRRKALERAKVRSIAASRYVLSEENMTLS